MKLVILITVIACSYADKLDRTYLPPATSGSAGGSPGSLVAPGVESTRVTPQGPSPFVQSSGPSSFGPSSGPSSFGQPSAPSFSQPSGQQNQAGSPSAQGQPGFDQSGPQFNKAESGEEPGTPSFGNGVAGFDQTPFIGGQDQRPSGPSQPERARASLDRNAETLRYENHIDGDSFAYDFETSNGIAADESGVATNGVRAEGGFSYTGDDGRLYSVRYTADENGYRPYGDHLPTPHPIPEEILKSLEQNAKAAAAGTQEGAYNPAEDAGLGSNGEEHVTSPGQDGNQAYPTFQSGQDSASQYDGNSVSTEGFNNPNQQGFRQDGPVSPNASGDASSPVSYSGSQGPTQGGQTPSSLYGAPSTSSVGSRPGSQRFPSQGNQYNAPSAAGSNGSRFPSQGSQSPNTVYGAPAKSPSVATPGSQDLPSQENQSNVSQYNAPAENSSFGSRFQAQDNQSPNSLYDAPARPPSSFAPGSQSLPSQGNQSPASKYSPSAVGFSGSGLPSQNAQAPTSLYGAPARSPSAAISGSQGVSSQRNQFSDSKYKAPGAVGTSGSLLTSHGNKSPTSLYDAPARSPTSRPTSQGTSFQGNQTPASLYNTPATLSPNNGGLPKDASKSQGSQNPSSLYGAPSRSPNYQAPSSHQNRFPASQNNAPGLSAPGAVGAPGSRIPSQGSLSPFNGAPARSPIGLRPSYQTPSSQGTRSHTSQYNAPGAIGSTGSAFPTQASQTPNSIYNAPARIESRPQSPISQYNTPSKADNFGSSPARLPSYNSSPSGSVSGYEYKAPNAIATGLRPFESQKTQPQNQSPNFSTPSSSGPESQNVPSQGIQFSTPQFGSPASSFAPSGPVKNLGEPAPASEYGAPTSTPNYVRPSGQSFAPQQGATAGPTTGSIPSRSPAFQYNAPRGSEAPATVPSQVSQNEIYEYNVPNGSPASSSRPSSQGVSFHGSETPDDSFATTAELPSGPQRFQPQRGQSPVSQPATAGLAKPNSQGNLDLMSQYGAPIRAGQSNQEKPNFNRRPQFGGSGPTGAAPSASFVPQEQATQGDNESGYNYNRPQGQFGRPSQGQASGFPRPIGSRFDDNSKPSLSTTADSEDNDYSSGHVSSDKTNIRPSAPSQGSPFSQSGRYTPSRPSSGSSSPSYSSPDSSADNFGNAPQFQPGQVSGLKPAMPNSTPYQYNRPGTQGTLSQRPFGFQASPSKPSKDAIGSNFNRPGQTGPQSDAGQDKLQQTGPQPDFGYSGQDNTNGIGTQNGFEPSRQEIPSPIGSQPSFGSSGNIRPSENFGGPRQPPSFSSEEGYKY